MPGRAGDRGEWPLTRSAGGKACGRWQGMCFTSAAGQNRKEVADGSKEMPRVLRSGGATAHGRL